MTFPDITKASGAVKRVFAVIDRTSAIDAADPGGALNRLYIPGIIHDVWICMYKGIFPFWGFVFLRPKLLFLTLGSHRVACEGFGPLHLPSVNSGIIVVLTNVKAKTGTELPQWDCCCSPESRALTLIDEIID